MLFRFLLIRQEWQSKECTTRKYPLARVRSRSFTNLRPHKYSQGRFLLGAGASELRKRRRWQVFGDVQAKPCIFKNLFQPDRMQRNPGVASSVSGIKADHGRWSQPKPKRDLVT